MLLGDTAQVQCWRHKGEGLKVKDCPQPVIQPDTADRGGDSLMYMKCANCRGTKEHATGSITGCPGPLKAMLYSVR